MGDALEAFGVAQRIVRPASQAVRGHGEAPGGGGKGDLVLDLGDWVCFGGAHRVSVMVGRKKWKWKWECRNKEHIGEKKDGFETEM